MPGGLHISVTASPTISPTLFLMLCSFLILLYWSSSAIR